MIGYVYKGIEIELFVDGGYITYYKLKKDGKVYEEDVLEDVTVYLKEALLSDIRDDIDNQI